MSVFTIFLDIFLPLMDIAIPVIAVVVIIRSLGDKRDTSNAQTASRPVAMKAQTGAKKTGAD